MVTFDKTYFESEPVFGNADADEYRNTYTFLRLNKSVRVFNYSHEEIVNILENGKAGKEFTYFKEHPESTTAH